MNITICGGGNLGHVCAGFLAANDGNVVSLLTTSPQCWQPSIEVADCLGNTFVGSLARVSSEPSEIVANADIVLFCLPGFAIHDRLLDVRPHLSSSTLVGSVISSTGFFFEAKGLLPPTQPLFGFQRVPFIARITSYGRRAELKGYKDALYLAVENCKDKESVRLLMQQWFHVPVHLLAHYYEAALSNSNPLLHTARLYTMWKDWSPSEDSETAPWFYADWTDEASQLLLDMDEEFQAILPALGLRHGCVPPILAYYESEDAASLTRKIRSIPAFQGIAAPMRRDRHGKYAPDFDNRYFTEDFPYGLRFAVKMAERCHIPSPHMHETYRWGMACLAKYGRLPQPFNEETYMARKII